MYFIYTITVHESVYVGATTSFLKRSRTHHCCLKRIIKMGKLEVRTMQYKLFNVPELITHGYRIELFCECPTAEAAKEKEQELLNKYFLLGKSLNVNSKSGLPVNSSKRRPKAIRSKYRRF